MAKRPRIRIHADVNDVHGRPQPVRPGAYLPNRWPPCGTTARMGEHIWGSPEEVTCLVCLRILAEVGSHDEEGP